MRPQSNLSLTFSTNCRQHVEYVFRHALFTKRREYYTILCKNYQRIEGNFFLKFENNNTFVTFHLLYVRFSWTKCRKSAFYFLQNPRKYFLVNLLFPTHRFS